MPKEPTPIFGKKPPSALVQDAGRARTPLEQRSGSKPLEPSAQRRPSARKDIKRAK